MWPLGHLALGYLLFTLGARLETGKPPGELAVLTLAVGTQLPDLIDKPGAYWFGLFAEGRALGHSLFFLVALCAVVGYLGVAYDRRQSAGAFAIGALSHPLADALPVLVKGRFGELSFALWPVLASPNYPTRSFGPHVAHWSTQLHELTLLGFLTQWQSFFVIQLWLTVLAAVVWVGDGRPGLALCWRSVRSLRTVV